jgi:hypothetical protein
MRAVKVTAWGCTVTLNGTDNVLLVTPAGELDHTDHPALSRARFRNITAPVFGPAHIEFPARTSALLTARWPERQDHEPPQLVFLVGNYSS